MNDLELFGANSPAKISGVKDMADALKTASAEGARGLPDGGVYISFSGKRGVYSIGEAGDDADPEECWLVNIYGFERGYICWKGGSPVAKRMASVYAAPIPVPDFNEHGPFDANRGEGWFSAKAMTLRSLDRGLQGLFQTNTKSAVSEFAKLEGAIADRLSEGLPPWPVIQLSSEEFVAQGQRNSKPRLVIYGWLYTSHIQRLAAMATVEDVAEALEAFLEEADANAEAGIVDAPLEENDTPVEVEDGNEDPDGGSATDAAADATDTDDAVEDKKAKDASPRSRSPNKTKADTKAGPPTRRRSRV